MTESDNENEINNHHHAIIASNVLIAKLERRLIAVERALEAVLRIQEDQKNQSKLTEWYSEDDCGWYP